MNLFKRVSSQADVTPLLDGKGRNWGFEYKCVAGKSIAYECCDSAARPNGSGGVLAVGSRLWLKEPLPKEGRKPSVIAFAPRLGSVLIDSRFLIQLGSEDA